MSNNREVIAAGGSVVDEGQPWIVSYWYIPDGCDYVNAKSTKGFFDNEANATAFAKQNEMPPEMAILLTRDQYESVKASVAASTH